MATLAPVNASAQIFQLPSPKPFVMQGTATLTYGSLPMGKVTIDASQNGADFQMHAAVRLVGVAKLISSHQSANQITGKLSDSQKRDFLHAERLFQSNYTSNDGWRTITLGYDAAGELVKEQIQSTTEVKVRPKVPEEQKQGVYDTLSLVFAAREAIFTASQNKQSHLSMKFYDGKRLSNANISVYGVVQRKWKNQKIPVLKVGFLREPIAGYTEKELKRAREKPMGELLIYFTANDNFVPVLAELSTVIGTIRAEFKAPRR